MAFVATFFGANLAVDWTLAGAIFGGTEKPFITPARTLSHGETDEEETLPFISIEKHKDGCSKDRQTKNGATCQDNWG